MKTLLLLLQLAFWWPVGQVSRFLRWLFERPFVLLYILGLVCWWTALYTIGHHLAATMSPHDGTLLVVGCLFLMIAASFPSRLARLLLLPLVIAIEMLFFFTGHHFLFYKIAAFFSTGFLLGTVNKLRV